MKEQNTNKIFSLLAISIEEQIEIDTWVELIPSSSSSKKV